MLLQIPLIVLRSIFDELPLNTLASMRCVSKNTHTAVQAFIQARWSSIQNQWLEKGQASDDRAVLSTMLKYYYDLKHYHMKLVTASQGQNQLKQEVSRDCEYLRLAIVHLVSLTLFKPDFDVNAPMIDAKGHPICASALDYLMHVVDETPLSTAVIRALLRKKVSLATCFNIHPFYQLVQKSNLAAIRVFIEEKKAPLEKMADCSMSALDYALCRFQNVQTNLELVTPLNRPVFELLVKLGAKPSFYACPYRLLLNAEEMQSHHYDLMLLPTCADRVVGLRQQLLKSSSQ